MRGLAVVAALAVALPTIVSAQSGPGDLAFDVPPGYVAQRKDGIVILAPAAPDQHSCIYGLAGRHAATGPLEASAEAAVVQLVVPGWTRLDDRHAAMRGVSAAGWPYAWWRAAFATQGANGQRQAMNAMALVLPAGPNQVHVVFGMGSISRCLLDDATFEALFHSLKPAGWTSDRGQALTRGLLGSWRYNTGTSVGLQQIAFGGDGRYARDVGTRTRLGVTERTGAVASGGRFALRDGELTLVPDDRPASPDRYRVRVYEEWLSGRWKRAMTLTATGGGSPGVVQYYAVDP